MAPRDMSLGEAAKAIGVSLDTLRRWDRAGKLKTTRDEGNRRRVPKREVERLAARPRRAPNGGAPSAPQPFPRIRPPPRGGRGIGPLGNQARPVPGGSAVHP